MLFRSVGAVDTVGKGPRCLSYGDGFLKHKIRLSDFVDLSIEPATRWIGHEGESPQQS